MLDMWLKDDIANVLQGIARAAPHMGVERTPAEADAFREGFMAALSSVALSLGIPADTHHVRMVSRDTQLLSNRGYTR